MYLLASRKVTILLNTDTPDQKGTATSPSLWTSSSPFLGHLPCVGHRDLWLYEPSHVPSWGRGRTQIGAPSGLGHSIWSTRGPWLPITPPLCEWPHPWDSGGVPDSRGTTVVDTSSTQGTLSNIRLLTAQ